MKRYVLIIVLLLVLGGSLFFLLGNQRFGNVKVGGVSLQGKNRQEALETLETHGRQYLKNKTLILTFPNGSNPKKVNVDPQSYNLHSNFKTVLDQAWNDHAHNLASRLVSRIMGERAINYSVPLTYRNALVQKTITNVRKEYGNTAVAATVEPTRQGIRIKNGHPGFNFLRPQLHVGLKKLLTTENTKIMIQAKKTFAMNRAQLRETTPAYIHINKDTHQLKFYSHLYLKKTYGIAVGKAGFDTPTGLYTVVNKQTDPTWQVPNKAWAGSLAGQTIPGGSPLNPLKARWLGLSIPGVGIHGTAEDFSIGQNASHGCIRMHVSDVKQLYPLVPLNTPVYITN